MKTSRRRLFGLLASAAVLPAAAYARPRAHVAFVGDSIADEHGHFTFSSDGVHSSAVDMRAFSAASAEAYARRAAVFADCQVDAVVVRHATTDIRF